MTIVVDSNILIAFGLADEPFYTQANQILSAWQVAGERLVAPRFSNLTPTPLPRRGAYISRKPDSPASQIPPLSGRGG